MKDMQEPMSRGNIIKVRKTSTGRWEFLEYSGEGKDFLRRVYKGAMSRYAATYTIDALRNAGYKVDESEFSENKPAPKVPRQFASLSWNAEDVKTIRPKWSKKKCEEELAANEKHIRDRLCELGWDVLDVLLSPK